MRADLHCHSVYSDGNCTVQQLVQIAKSEQVEALALTDHDTISGNEEFRRACIELDILPITGIEISCRTGEQEVHILGYGFDLTDEFCEYLEFLKSAREARNKKILYNLSLHNINIDYEEMAALTKFSISRSHIARLMVAKGYENTIKDCFDKWLRCGSPAFEPHFENSPFEAVEIIDRCHGVSVLAHPVRLNISSYDKISLVKQLSECGLFGIEGQYKDSSKDSVKFFRELAKRNNLLVTNGGDFHNNKTDHFYPREMDEKSLYIFLQHNL